MLAIHACKPDILHPVYACRSLNRGLKPFNTFSATSVKRMRDKGWRMKGDEIKVYLAFDASSKSDSLIHPMAPVLVLTMYHPSPPPKALPRGDSSSPRSTLATSSDCRSC